MSCRRPRYLPELLQIPFEKLLSLVFVSVMHRPADLHVLHLSRASLPACFLRCRNHLVLPPEATTRQSQHGQRTWGSPLGRWQDFDGHYENMLICLSVDIFTGPNFCG
jgi:hypothetical protein